MTTSTNGLRQHVDSPNESAERAQEALLNKIDRLASAANSPAAVLQLAEAYAYVVGPGDLARPEPQGRTVAPDAAPEPGQGASPG